jgi:hypothetical protein
VEKKFPALPFTAQQIVEKSIRSVGHGCISVVSFLKGRAKFLTFFAFAGKGWQEAVHLYEGLGVARN